MLVKNVLRKAANLVGNPLKSFLEVVRFFWTDYGPVGMHGDPNRMYFHDFPYHLRLAGGPAGW